MLVASAGELASAFGWPRAAAGAALEELVERGEAVGERAPTGPRVAPHRPKTTFGVLVEELRSAFW